MLQCNEDDAGWSIGGVDAINRNDCDISDNTLQCHITDISDSA